MPIVLKKIRIRCGCEVYLEDRGELEYDLLPCADHEDNDRSRIKKLADITSESISELQKLYDLIYENEPEKVAIDPRFNKTRALLNF